MSFLCSKLFSGFWFPSKLKASHDDSLTPCSPLRSYVPLPTPTSTPLQTHRSPCHYSNMPGTCPPRGLCPHTSLALFPQMPTWLFSSGLDSDVTFSVQSFLITLFKATSVITIAHHIPFPSFILYCYTYHHLTYFTDYILLVSPHWNISSKRAENFVS